MRDIGEPPGGVPQGRIRMLDGMNEKGVFQNSTIYADKLAWPSAVTCYAGGVFVAAGQEILYLKDAAGNGARVLYCEQTGTSMAAPHVSGAIAAFLSVRSEFIGQPERVKELIVGNTIDLRRERTCQGTGLLDLMKVLQAV